MSPRLRLTPCLLAAATVATLLFSGCSSSDSGIAAPSTSSAVATSSVSAATSSATVGSNGAADTVAATAESSGSLTESSGSATTSASGVDAGSSTESVAGSKQQADPVACASTAQLYGAVINATLPVLQGKTGPTPFDAEKLSTALSTTTMGTVPAELDPSFAALKTAAEQLKGKDLTAAAALFDAPALTKATGNIEKYLSDHC